MEMKILTIREAFKLRLSLIMTLNDENPEPNHPHHHHIWNSLFFYISMDFPIYLPTTKVFIVKLQSKV